MNTINFPRMHVSLYVSDIEQTVQFYNRFFGVQATKIKPDYAKYELSKPGLIISFVQHPERVAGNFGHLGIQVGSEQELMEKLDAARFRKLNVLEELDTNCCYARQDKFWVADPDGHQWEVYYFHEDVSFNDPRYENDEANACCTPPSAEKKRVKLSELTPSSCEPKSGCC